MTDTFSQLTTASGKDLRMTPSHLVLSGSSSLAFLPLVQASSLCSYTRLFASGSCKGPGDCHIGASCTGSIFLGVKETFRSLAYYLIYLQK